jgi:hypothetical protein
LFPYQGHRNHESFDTPGRSNRGRRNAAKARKKWIYSPYSKEWRECLVGTPKHPGRNYRKVHRWERKRLRREGRAEINDQLLHAWNRLDELNLEVQLYLTDAEWDRALKKPFRRIYGKDVVFTFNGRTFASDLQMGFIDVHDDWDFVYDDYDHVDYNDGYHIEFSCYPSGSFDDVFDHIRMYEGYEPDKTGALWKELWIQGRVHHELHDSYYERTWWDELEEFEEEFHDWEWAAFNVDLPAPMIGAHCDRLDERRKASKRMALNEKWQGR